jgi:hypothetical protein
MTDSELPSEAVPGDITITPIDHMYLLGRVLSLPRQGPWWEYVASVRDASLAVRWARELAQLAGTKAWLHNGTAYALISSAETGAV